MDKKVLKKFLFVLSILFTVLTFLGTVYVLLNKGQVSAGYATVPMLWACLLYTSIMKLRMVKFARVPSYNQLFSGDPVWATVEVALSLIHIYFQIVYCIQRLPVLYKYHSRKPFVNLD